MALVRMKVQISGSRDGVDWPARGETADVPDGEAALLVATGIAEVAEVAEETATASAAGVETATPPVKRTR